MTWIVGFRAVAFAVMIADTRETDKHGNPQPRPAEKIYKIRPSGLVGFSGAVKVGLPLKDDFLDFHAYGAPVARNPYDGTPADPAEFIGLWAERARGVANSISRNPSEGYEFMYLEVSSTQKSQESINLPLVYGYILRSPRFEPEEMAPHQAYSIGRGSSIPEYTTFLQEMVGQALASGYVTTEQSVLLRAVALSDALSRRIKQIPEKAVGPLLMWAIAIPGDAWSGGQEADVPDDSV